jgi:hypothetical protein
MDLSLAKYQPPALFLTTLKSGNSTDLKWKKWSREIHAFLDAIAQGMPTIYACNDSGLCYSTVCQWLNPNSAIHDPRFQASFDKAHAHAVKSNIKRINASRDWKAAAFWLERNTPHFAPKSFASHSFNAEIPGSSPGSAANSAINQDDLTKLTSAHERLVTKLSAKHKGQATKHSAKEAA